MMIIYEIIKRIAFNDNINSYERIRAVDLYYNQLLFGLLNYDINSAKLKNIQFKNATNSRISERFLLY
jgi:hypothetical protein